MSVAPTTAGKVERTNEVRFPDALPWLLGVALLLSGFFVNPRYKLFPTAWTIPLQSWFRAIMAVLTSDSPIAPGLPPFSTITRSLAHLLDLALILIRDLLADGFGHPLGLKGPELPALPWYVIIVGACLVALRLEGIRLAAITLAGLGFIVLTGNWQPSMVTLSSVFVATALTISLGMLSGVAAYRIKAVDRLLSPMLDVLQTMPVFAYLVPVLMLFGFGPAAALAATIAYALPPMIRNTLLGLRRVSSEVIEFGQITGCSSFQLLSRILIPSALPTIMLGVNQAVMMTLSMAIIASMIGAGGLGFNVLTSLRRLDIGGGSEAGLAIVALAVILDRQSQAMARVSKDHHLECSRSTLQRRGWMLATVAAVLTYAAAVANPTLAHYPDWLTFTARDPLNDGARWLTSAVSAPVDQIKIWLLLNVMVPLRIYMTGLPWFTLPMLAGLVGWRLGGWRLLTTCTILLTLIFATGFQSPALLTVYLCGLGTLASLLLGVPLGVLSARSERWHAFLMLACDTLQTLPPFVYLIPVVMLFKNGDFAALVAIVAYAIVPAIRYTDFGLRNVPTHLIEAGVMAGCKPWQIFCRVEVPLATPEIILGVSQTIMMAFSMLVITALVGTRDLGQETYIALSRADAGQGLMAGLSIAFLAIVADRLLVAWSAQRTARLGLR